MKRKQLLTKTFLIAAMLFVGMNASWATDVTLDPTADTWVNYKSADDAQGTNYGSATSLTAGIWQDMWSNATPGLKNNSYGAFAMMKFDVSAYKGKITAASFKITATLGVSNSNRDLYIGYYTGTDWTEGTVTANNSGIEARSATNLNIGHLGTFATVTKNSTEEYTCSSLSALVNYLNDDEDGIVTLIFYTYTADISIASKEATSGQPKLTLTYTNETLYSASFNEGNNLTPTVKIYSDAGRTSEVTNGTLVDKTTYYYRATLHGYTNYEGSFTVNGANPSENFTMTAAEQVTSLKVYAKINNENHLIKSIELTDKYVGEQVSFAYPKYYKIGTTLYEISDDHYNKHGGYYKWNNYTLEGSSVVLDYDKGVIENVVYYKEGEEIDGMTADASKNADIRCSGGQGGRSADELSLTTLEAGVYKLCSQVWGASGSDYTFRAEGSDILAHSTTGSLNGKDVSFSVVSGTAEIKVQGVNTGGRVLDYVYIQKLDDATVSVNNGDFENSTWDTGWLGTGTDKVSSMAKQTSPQTWGATGNFAEMWTDSGFSAEANLRQILINVPAGNYILSADILNNVSSSGGVLYAKVDNASDVTTAAENAAGANESISFTVEETSNVELGFKTTAISGKNGWIAMDNFVLNQVVPATISTSGYTSLSSAYALDFSKVEGLTAYVVKEATSDGVTLSSVNEAPAETGLILKGTVGETYNIPVVASAEEPAVNLLSAAVTATEVEDGSVYILKGGKFCLLNGATTVAARTIPAGKAYLPKDKVTTGKADLTVAFEEEAVTDIESVQDFKGSKVQGFYDLQGRRVSQPTKGMYIMDGKKVVVK